MYTIIKGGRMALLYIDIGLCSECRGCVEIAPDIFRFNPVASYMEAVDLEQYDENLVQEAIKNCPKNCIHYENHSSVVSVVKDSVYESSETA